MRYFVGSANAHVLSKLIQTWQKEHDFSGFVAVILINPSKSIRLFILLYDLLIAELEGYDIDNLLSIYRQSIASK